MQAWLAAANRGHYIAPNRDTLTADASYRAGAQPAVYTASTQPTSYPPSTASTASTQPSQSAAIPTYEPLGADPTSQIGQTTASGQTETPSAGAMQPQSLAPVAPSNPEQLLNIGSSASAVLQSAVAWTATGPDQALSYRLRLKEGFKNQMGTEVLPKGTDLIAQVTEKTSSGLFFMEVTHILVGSNRDRVPVSAGALQVVADDGSPLQAKLKQKGGRNFLADAAAILAPGIERAMGSIADSADSLILEDGDRSLIRTSGDNSNPLAAGVSGVAEGVAEKFGQQNTNSRNDTSAPYFKLSEGETVRIIVNQDIQL